MQISLDQIAELEAHHGKGMIVVLSVVKQEGERELQEDFAFRRPVDNEVAYALSSKDLGQLTFLEELTMGCVLTVDAPRAGAPSKLVDGKPTERYAGLTQDEKQFLLVEKGRLKALWDDAQQLRDEISLQLSWTCGSHPQLGCESLGSGRYSMSLKPNETALEFGIDYEVNLVCRKPTRKEYDRYKTLEIGGGEGDAQYYLYNALVESSNKTEVSRLYPFAVIAVGRYLPTLGTDGRSVRVKKYSNGQAQEPGSSTEKPASEVISA